MKLLDDLFERNKKTTSITGSILLFLMMLLLFWNMAGADTMTVAEIEKWMRVRDSGDGFDVLDHQRLDADVQTINEYVGEDAPLELVHSIFDVNVCNVTFCLTWTDEGDAGWIGNSPNHENQPDSFMIKVDSPAGDIHQEASGSNAPGESAALELTLSVPVKDAVSYNGTGDWNITISVVAGDHTPKYVGLFKFDDVGNDFELDITYQYYVPHEQ